MQIRLIVTRGPRKGEEFSVKDDIIIGRKKCDLPLLDDRASTEHAKIYKDTNDIVYIGDLNSSNGTFVNGQKISSAPLKVGDIITIGKTDLKVEEQVVRDEKNVDPGSWQEVVDAAITQRIEALEAAPPSKIKTKNFEKPVLLDFVQGVQTGTQFVFGYGPREVGAHCSEGLLFDKEAPPVAFRLKPATGALCEFFTEHASVLVNNSYVEHRRLKNGDRISFGQTVIVVKSLVNL